MSEILGQGLEKPIGKWATSKEFLTEKVITPTSLARLCGEETNAGEKFRDKDGCTYRMTFIDHDNGDMERMYENCYSNFIYDVQSAKVEKGKKYAVLVNKIDNKYKWTFTKRDE